MHKTLQKKGKKKTSKIQKVVQNSICWLSFSSHLFILIFFFYWTFFQVKGFEINYVFPAIFFLVLLDWFLLDFVVFYSFSHHLFQLMTFLLLLGEKYLRHYPSISQEPFFIRKNHCRNSNECCSQEQIKFF